MVDVRRDDRAAAGDLVADELRRDLVRDAGAPRVSGMLAREAAAAAPGPIALAPGHRGPPPPSIPGVVKIHLAAARLPACTCCPTPVAFTHDDRLSCHSSVAH